LSALRRRRWRAKHYINRTYRRSGKLWEGRFRSCPTQDETYLLSCQRYIELNRCGRIGWPICGVSLVELSGERAASCQTAYRELFRDELEPGLVNEIRHATNGNVALAMKVLQRKSWRLWGGVLFPENPGGYAG
jgi:putative transposase